MVLAGRSFAGDPVYNWTGTTTNDALWTNSAYWGGTLPTGTTDAWMNVPNAYSYVDPTVAGNGHQIIVGRSNGSAQLDMTGGTLTSTDEFYLGQYAGASGTMNLTGGTLTIGLNFSVGGTGVGTFEMTGGSLKVASAIKVNRYTGTGASGYADIAGGTVSAADLNIGSSGAVVLDNTTLTLGGNRVTELNGYLASGALAIFWGAWAPPTPSIQPSYDGTSKTTLTVPNGRYAGIGYINFLNEEGDAPVTFDYTNLRRLSPAPAFGIHPRIVCGPADLPDIAARLQNTQWGQALNTMISDYTLILRNGYPAYDALPASARVMPNNLPRIANEGLYDRSVVYNDLASGGTSRIAAMNSDSTGSLVLGGEMALEAFQCALNHSQSGYAQRMTTLCAALDTWAVYAAGLTTLSADPWQFGDFHTALAYDFAYNYMTSTQRADVRKAIAIMLGGYKSSYYGVGLDPKAVTSNWADLWTHELLMGYAIEGEVQTGDAGYSASDLASFQASTMVAMNNFFTYGWSQDGSPYEGMGKDYIYASHQIAWAKRGFDFFGNLAIRNYADDYMPALMQPYGYAFTKFDVLGGSGNVAPATGGFTFEPNDYVGLKWMYPNDNAVDFCFRNFINTPYVDGSGNPQVFLDPTDKKLTCRSIYANSLLMAAIFATDVSSTESWNAQRAEVVQLTYHDGDAGTISYLSDLTGNATQLLVHMRNNFGGHTNADRNTFGLSALGRLYVNFDTNIAGLQDPEYQSIVDVDGESMFVTGLEGNKCRIPEKIAGWVENVNASFVTGDATYAYSNQWYWQNYQNTSTFSPKQGYTKETNTFNTFRRSNAQITDSHGNVPLFSYPAWDKAGYNEGIEKEPYNPMTQVYRTLGLVRGTSPYTLVIDDVQKDAGTHDYRWYVSVPTDLSLITGTSLPAGFNPATDVLLQESTGPVTRQLLIRVLQANGTPVQASGTKGSTLAYLETIQDSGGANYNRVVIERSNVVAPGFTVMLYPMHPTDPVPVTSWTGNNLNVSIGSQADLFTFYPRSATVAGQTVNMREFVLTRGGSPLVDYRNQIEPLSVR